jgi:PhnB protein
MTPIPYITFKGNCREAMAAYAGIFGGEVTVMVTGAEMPGMPVPEDKANWIMHSAVRFEGGTLMGSDDMMGGLPPMGGCWVMMEMPTVERARTVFAALSAGGSVGMDLKPTEWSPGFGMVTDRFAIPWMISTASAET